MPLKKFDWEDVEARIRKELGEATDMLCAEQDWETTIALRMKIKTFKRILQWPHEDLDRIEEDD